MRLMILALTAAIALSAAPAALCAPTCLDRNADTIRCGTQGAMPVGWVPSPQQVLEHQAARPLAPTLDELWPALFIIIGIFGLIAVMPDFDGWRVGDWDPQEGDDEERG